MFYAALERLPGSTKKKFVSNVCTFCVTSMDEKKNKVNFITKSVSFPIKLHAGRVKEVLMDRFVIKSPRIALNYHFIFGE